MYYRYNIHTIWRLSASISSKTLFCNCNVCNPMKYSSRCHSINFFNFFEFPKYALKIVGINIIYDSVLTYCIHVMVYTIKPGNNTFSPRYKCSEMRLPYEFKFILRERV